MLKDHEQVDILIGVDVGKSNHHAVAIDRAGKKLLDRALPQDEGKLRAIVKAVADKGTVLLVVVQPATIYALPVSRRGGFEKPCTLLDVGFVNLPRPLHCTAR